MKDVFLNSGETAIIRRLTSEDFDDLFYFLNRLTADIKAKFAPHAFDEATIRELCNNHKLSDTHPYLALNQDGSCIAYFLLKSGLIWHDADRLRQYGMNPEAHTYGTFAPCVAADYQGTGLAQGMLHHIEAEALRLKMNRLILWGGVQQRNERAVHFYEKSGFRTVGQFEYHGQNLDMVKDIIPFQA